MTPKSIVECCDCMNFMAKFPDKFFNLAIVDPPYNIVSQQKRGVGSRIDPSGKMNNWNHEKPKKEYFEQLFRVSKKQIIWGSNNFEGLPPTEYFVIWDKQQTVNNFASAEYAWTNVKQPALVFRYAINKEMINRQRGGGKIHPTQKPVALYIWQLQNYAKPGDKILDTHLGSQSSRVAARIMGFDFWGCEIDPDYFADGCKRFEKESAQEMLFQAPQREEANQPNLFNEEQ